MATRIDNSLRVAYVVSSPIIGLVMRYVRHTKPFVIFGVPLTIIGLGLQVLMCSREHKASEAQFIVAKVLVGVGRGIWTTAALVTIQGSGTLNEIATSTGIYYAVSLISPFTMKKAHIPVSINWRFCWHGH